MSEKVTFELNLDDADFVKKLLTAKSNLKGLGASDNFKGLLENLAKGKDGVAGLADSKTLTSFTQSFMKLGTVVAAFGAAVALVKGSMDLVLEAESIKAVNTQFELLTQNAGIATETLREGLLKAADGLVDDTELLEAANKAIIQMGRSAERIPEIMDLARQATTVFGGSLVQNFEAINQAVATGQTRQLRNLGLIVDADKAYQNYARSIGIAASTLSEAGRQQALMNAVLETGSSRFKGVDPSIKEATNTLQQLKVTFQQVAEVVVLFLDKAIGPTVKWWLTATQKAAQATKDWLVRSFGEGTEAAKLNLDRLEEEMRKKATLIANLEKSGQREGGDRRDYSDIVAKERAKYELLRAERNKYLGEISADDKKHAEQAAKTGAGPSSIDTEKAAAQQAKFEADISRMREARLQAEARMVETEAQLQASLQARKLSEVQAFEAQVAQIHANKELTDLQKTQMEEEAARLHQTRLSQIEESGIQEREAMYERFMRHNKGVMDGIARAAQVASSRAANSLKAGGDAGRKTFDMLSSTAFSAFEEIGRGAATGTLNMKKIVLGGIGDIAIAHGQMQLLAGIWPPNPGALAAGAALMILGGALKGFAGGGGASAAGGVQGAPASGGGAAAGDLGADTATSERPQTSEVPQKKSVTIQVMGNYFETEQTKMKLVEMVREATDATDFAYVRVGRTYGT